MFWQERKTAFIKTEFEIVSAFFCGWQLVDLMWEYEKKLVFFNVELLEVNTMVGDAFQHKSEKVMRFAVSKTVLTDDFDGKVAEGGGDEADGEYIVLFVEMEE